MKKKKNKYIYLMELILEKSFLLKLIKLSI